MAETHHKDRLLSARCIFGGPAAPWRGLLAITWIPSSLWGKRSAFWPVHINSSLGDLLTLRIIQAGKLMSGETCMISKSEELEHFFFFSYTKGLANDKTYLYRGILNLQE